MRKHPGEAFSAATVARDIDPPFHPSSIAAILNGMFQEGFPHLRRINRTTCIYEPPDGGAPPVERLRIVREPPVLLKPGVKVEIVGATLGGVIVGRDPVNRLWRLVPLEVPE
jgi:hypothetical protein